MPLLARRVVVASVVWLVACGDDPNAEPRRRDAAVDELDAAVDDLDAQVVTDGYVFRLPPGFDWGEYLEQLAQLNQGTGTVPNPDERLHDGSLPDVDAGLCPLALTRDEKPLAPCSQWCELIDKEPKAKTTFFLEIKSFDERGCFLAYAAAQGLDASEWVSTYVMFEATFEQAKPLLQLDIVSYIDFSCPTTEDGRDCEDYCAPLEVAACKADPRCDTYNASHVNPAKQCAERVEVGCGPSSRGCSELITFATDPEGQCYTFSNGCQPRGFVEQSMPCGDGRSIPVCPAN